MVDIEAEIAAVETGVKGGAKGGAIGAGAIEAKVWLVLVVLIEVVKGLVLEALGTRGDKGNQGG